MSRPLRNPGPVERYFLIKSVNSLYPNFSLTATYNLPVTDAILSNALKLMIEENPWLTYTFYKVEDLPAGDVDDWKLGAVSRINYSDVVSHIKIDAFDDEELTHINTLHLTLNDDTLPLWKIRVYDLPDGTQKIAVYVDHTIYDGRSGLFFHQCLCKYMSDSNYTETKEVLFDAKNVSGAPKPLLHCSEDNPFFAPIASDKFWAFVKFKTPVVVTKAYDYVSSSLNSMIPYKPTNPTFSLGPQIKSIDTKVLSFNLTSAQVDQAVSFCRANQLTLTPLIQAIFAQCLEEVVFPNVDSSKKFSTRIAVAIDLRKALPKGYPFEFGMTTTLDNMMLPLVAGRLKTFVNYIQAHYNRNAAERYQFMARVVGFLKFLPHHITSMLSFSCDRHTCVLSNVGRVEDGGHKYKIDDMIFNKTVGTTTFTTCCVASTQKGGMNTTVSYVSALDNYMAGDEPVMEIFIRELKKKLLGVTSGTIPLVDVRY